MKKKASIAVMTIDLEDWFHPLEPDPGKWDGFQRRAEIGAAILLECLAKYGSIATFFVLGDVAQKCPGIVRAIQSAGHEIGSHGMSHRFVTSCSPEEFRMDLRSSLTVLESITGAPVHSFRAPYFSISKNSEWALRILLEEGITVDSSIFPIRNPRYGIPNARRTPHDIIPGLLEWPITTFPSILGNIPVAGGVYLRILPWRGVYWALRKLQKRGEPVLIYLHPWEVDADQPRFKTTSAFLNLRHYWRLGATRSKLENILSKINFTSLANGIELLRKEGSK